MPSWLVVAADRLLSCPLWALKSSNAKPVGASLKVIVAVAVSPIFNALSLSVMLAVGAVRSMISAAFEVDSVVLPAASLTCKMTS